MSQFYIDSLYPYHKTLPVSPDNHAFFQTLGAAKTVARPGDVIVVYPGTYTEGDLFVDQVNWHFLPGATVIPPTGTHVFDDHGVNVSCVVFGAGAFQLAEDSKLIKLTGTLSTITFQAESVVATEIGTEPLVLLTGGVSYVNVHNFLADNRDEGIKVNHASAVLYLTVHFLSIPDGIGINCDNGLITAFVHRFNTTTDVDISGGSVYCITCKAGSNVQTGGTLEFLDSSGGGGGGGGSVGVGSPEGVVTADPGTDYLDSTSNAYWYKKTGSGNTGWVNLIA